MELVRVLQKHRMLVGISLRPWVMLVKDSLYIGLEKTYNSKSHPGLCQVNQQTILSPSPSLLNFFDS